MNRDTTGDRLLPLSCMGEVVHVRYLPITEHRGRMKTSGLVLLLKWLVSGAIAIWISIPIAVQLLTILCAVDLLSSIGNPMRHFRDVLRRIATMLLLVMTVYLVYNTAKQQTGFNVGFDIAAAVCTFYIIGESIYILQNCAAAGLRIPPWLLRLLAKSEDLTRSERRDVETLENQQVADRSSLSVQQAEERRQSDRD